MNSQNALEYVKERREKKVNGIPTSFKIFNKILPAWDINTTTTIAAGSGVGKTSFAWNYCVMDVVKYLYKNPEIKAHIYFFSLELKYTEVYIKLFTSLLMSKFKKKYSRTLLLGLTEERLTDEELNFLEEEAKPFLEFLDSKVTIIDYASTPNSMFSTLVDAIDATDDEYKFVIIDTVNAISADPGEQKMESLKKWNQDYALKVFRNEKDCTVIHLQQIDKNSTTRQYSNKGESVWEKYIPTKESLGNDKEAVNSSSLVVALFDPVEFKIREIEGWYPLEWDNGLRLLYVLKNNFGDINVSVPFYYNGETNTWIEIEESPEEFTKDKSLYKKYIKNYGNSGKKISELY